MIFKIEAPVGRLIFCIKKQLFTNMAIIGGMPGKGAEEKLKGIVFGFFVVKGSETSLQELNFTRRETKLSIKSRRLFAILVITAMVLAMLPMTAFAQEADVVLGATDVEVDETDLAVGEKAKVTMTFYDLNGKPLENVTTPFSFYIKTSRSKADQVTTDDETKGTISPSAFSIVGGGGTSVSVEGVEGGQVSFYISSNFVGSSTITFWDGEADVDGSEEFGRITLNYSAAKYDKDNCELTATDTENEVTTTGAITMAIFKNLKLEAEILTESDVPVKGETVTFQKSREGGAWTTIASKATDVLGKASINTTESVAGKYEYRARIGGTTVGNTVKVTFTGTHPTAIKAETADGGVAVDESQTVKFKVTDAFDNAVAGQKVKLELTKRPSGSASYSSTTPETDDKGIVEFEFTPTKVGEYQVKATVVDTGLTATVTLTAAEFGNVAEVKLGLAKDRVSIKSGWSETAEDGNKMTLDVKLVDESGNTKKVTDGTDVKLSTSNVTLATVEPGTLTIIASSDSKNRGIVTITATHIESGKYATLDIPVVGKPAAIKETVTADGDKSVAVSLQFVDADGNATWDKDEESTGLNVYAPDAVTISEVKSFAKGTGKASFKAVADEYGVYNITVVSDNGLAKTFAVNFGEPEPEVIGAKSVLMFIGSKSYVADGAAGSMDIAPFIEDGRTFVPVRFIGEAFGAELDWEPKDAATEKVFITRDDIQVTITIGEYTIEVVRDGETETAVSDVAAFIRDGRTFLPLRVIGEIFGAEFDWGPKDAETEWVSFTQ